MRNHTETCCRCHESIPTDDLKRFFDELDYSNKEVEKYDTCLVCPDCLEYLTKEAEQANTEAWEKIYKGELELNNQ